MSEIEKHYNGETIVNFEEETELEKNYNKVAELYSKAVKKKIEYHKEIERLNNIINELEKFLKNEIKEYKEAGYDILEIRRANLWLTGCYDEDKEILNKIKELKEEK